MILIPPLLIAFDQLQLDRRLVACLLSFGLVTPYILLPIGFGELFLNQLIKPQIYLQGMVEVNKVNMMHVMAIPALGMMLGLLVAVFFSYKKPRTYQKLAVQDNALDSTVPKFTLAQLIYLSASILIFILVQLLSGSMALGALVGCFFICLKDWQHTNSRFSEGTKLMVL
jgi:predicted histidine transporter YuiF (NhaC family)